MTVPCRYGWSNEGNENGGVKNRSEIFRGGERVEIAWPLVFR